MATSENVKCDEGTIEEEGYLLLIANINHGEGSKVNLKAHNHLLAKF